MLPALMTIREAMSLPRIVICTGLLVSSAGLGLSLAAQSRGGSGGGGSLFPIVEPIVDGCHASNGAATVIEKSLDHMHGDTEPRHAARR